MLFHTDHTRTVFLQSAFLSCAFAFQFFEQKFVLGPTPAQKKRLSPDEMDKILETVNFREKFSSLPEFKPGDSPTVVATSPKILIQSYARYAFIKPLSKKWKNIRKTYKELKADFLYAS